jgi:O-antigen ligase
VTASTSGGSPPAEVDVPTAVGALVSARLVLWTGLLLPFVYTTAKNASDLSGGGSVGTMEIVRGGGPALLWGLSILLAPTVRRGWGAVEVLLAVYGVVVLVSYLDPLNPSPQASLLKSLTLVSAFVLMIRLVRLYRSPSEVVVALTGFVHVVLLSGLIQIALLRSTVYQVGAGSIDDLPRLNLVVPSVSANPLAMLGVLGILSCAVGVAPRWLPFNGVVRNALMLVYAYEIFLTRTRSALAVGLVIIVVSLVVRARRHPLSSVVTGIVAVTAAFFLTPSLLPQLHAFLERGQTAHGLDTLSGRTVIWEAAHQVWLQHPWMGLGYYSGHRLGIPGLQESQSNIDNTWLETLVDVGIVGTVPLALFVLGGFWRLLRSRALQGDVRLWAVGASVYVVAISFVNPTVQQPGPGCVVLGMLILAMAPSRASRPRPADPLHDSHAVPAEREVAGVTPAGRWVS